MSQLINKITIFFIVFILLVASCAARTPADSLSAVLAQKNITPGQKVMTLSLLARAKSITENKTAIAIGLQAVALSRGLSDAQYTSIAYATLAQIYIQANDLTRSAAVVDSAVYYAEKTGSQLAKGIAWYRKCWMENIKGDEKNALLSGQQALKYLEKARSPYYASAVYYVMASIYANQEDGPLHKKYGQLSLQAALVDMDYDNILVAYQTLGTYWQYYHMAHTSDKAALDSAIYYNSLSIATYLNNKDRIIFHSTVAITALNLADIYAQNFPASYRDTVFKYLDIARKIGVETHHMEVVSNCYGMQSDYEAAAGHYDKAEELLQKGLAIINADSSNTLATKIQFMSALAALAEKRGNYKDALQYQQQFSALYKQLYNEEKLNITKELEAKYQAEKTATALRNLEQTASLHKTLGYLYIGLALALLTAAIFLFRSYHFRLKQLGMETRLKDEEAMRLIAEQQLMQERQERLQKDLLAGTLQVEQKNALVQTLQKKIAEHTNNKSVLTQINRIIDHDKRLDESLAEDKADFENVNPEVFDKLKERSDNSLSRLDLKHCAYIYIGLTNKEVSQRLGIAPKSILMARYRIKLKLGLGKDEELDTYIRSL
ncbi:helix-turn-helix transcriptional regulator [Chitinophaga sancti]|uniref:Regulatory protein, luxR family n=1 Tax=Chitinophaga sancti TaxID=1004 RepID=A0A1K1M267_9BACT|nr:hypothetical protein [Chitinophaga sancti]WQD64691.1 hypothetical protein U0033_09815 [Chitinophaga sancti]WQG89687.1 hypothetical protein SR876_32660 [Chitinophaga sancti]SFW17183.1 regulatory protein, luxR family [Chitinophaga sancti]